LLGKRGQPYRRSTLKPPAVGASANMRQTHGRRIRQVHIMIAARWKVLL
jgi:hypothetical protein